MTEENCKQTNIPVTDNTPLDCPTYILDKCLIVPQGNSFLATNDDDDLEEYHEKLVEKLIAQDQRIIVLENANPGTITYELSLSGTQLSISVNDSVVSTVNLQSLTSAGLTEAKEVFTSVGGESTFTVSNTINTTVPNQLIVEGITMLEGLGNDYTVSGNTITFTLAAPLQVGNIVQFFYKY
jgi:hypothetical protein